MGFWPFGGGKRQRMVGAEDHGREALLRRTPSDAQIHHEKVQETDSRAEKASGKPNREEDRSKRLSKTRTSSSRALARPESTRAQQDPSVQTSNDVWRTSRVNSQYNEKSLYQQVPLSQSSLQPENFTVISKPPTLYAKRGDSDAHLPRRKSSKRKAEDVAREREIRAMASSPIPIPKRPTTLYGTGPLQRDSKQFAGPLNRRLERPTSEISLPLPGSLLDVTDFPSQNSFRVGMFAALSPRPTIRYDAHPKIASGKQPIQPNMAIQRAIEEEDVSDKKRIDELADDLDAGGLRELMDRDRRRRERKKEADKIRLQRRLQRRAERQREEEEARRARTEAFVQSAPTGSSPAQGLGIDSTTEAGMPVVADNGDPFNDPVSLSALKSLIRNPFEDEKDMDIMQDLHNSDNEDDLEIEKDIKMVNTIGDPTTAQASLRQTETDRAGPREKPSQSTLSPPVSPVNRPAEQSSISQGSFPNPEPNAETSGRVSIERRTSGASSQRMSSWTTFFKRGSRRKFTGPSQGRTTPSEFSNTSRESFSRKQPPVIAPRTFRRSDSATPQRTLSRFREDLPELPISPPDSRLQSPEAAVPHARDANAIGSGQENDPESLEITTQTHPQPSTIRLTNQERQPRERGSTEFDNTIPSTVGMFLSQSLASVDSEASWLSGKPPKRQSGLSHAFKPSQSSLPGFRPGVDDRGGEDNNNNVEIRDDDSQRLENHPNRQQPLNSFVPGMAASNTAAVVDKDQSDFEDIDQVVSSPRGEGHKGLQGVEAETEGAVVPSLTRTRSDQGLLDELTTGGASSDDEDSELPSPEVEPPEVPILRARSVEYKGHIRHISAGSAKLLNLRQGSIHSDKDRPSSALGSTSNITR